MGNEQSVPSPRRPQNKLSKPKTNTSSANLLSNSNSNPLSQTTSNPNLLNGGFGRQSVPVSRLNSVQTGSLTGRAENDDAIWRRLSMLKAASLKGENGPETFEERGEDRDELMGKSTGKRKSFFRLRGKKQKEREEIESADDEFVGFDSEVFVEPEKEKGSGRWALRRRTTGNSVTAEEAEFVYSEHGIDLSDSKSSFRTSRNSLQQVSYSHHQQLSLVAELQSPVDEGTKRYSRYEKEEPRQDFGRSRTNSETTLHHPIRRRSLLQHGVATRRDSINKEQSEYENNYRRDYRQSLPATRVNSITNLQSYQQPPATYSQTPSPTKPTHIPVSELPPLAPPKPFQNAPPRTETPTEEYGHTGAFKLGTLRVVNGAASPTPSSERGVSMYEEDIDYLAVKRPRTSAEFTERPRFGERTNTILTPPKRALWSVRSEEKNKEDKPKSLMVQTHLPLPDLTFTPFDAKQTDEWFKQSDEKSKDLSLGNDYLLDVAMSPFSFENSPPLTPRLAPSPQLETTSKHMAVDDDLFEAEPTTPRLDGTSRMPTWRSSDSGYGGGERSNKTVKGPRDLISSDKPLKKADSGYSSNVSLRSFKKELSPAVPAKDAPAKTSRAASGTFSNDAQPEINMKRSLPAIPQDQTPSKPERQAPPIPSKTNAQNSYDNLLEITRPSPPPSAAAEKRAAALPQPKEKKGQTAIPSRLSEAYSRESSPAVSEDSTRSSTSTSTSISTSSRWRNSLKFGSKRPKSDQSMAASEKQPEQAFTIQALRPTSVLLVSPPSSTALENLQSRVDEFPSNSFPNTLPLNTRLRRTGSKETLGTIFSVGSTEVREELSFARLQKGLPPVPSEPTIMENPASPGLERPEMIHRPRHRKSNSMSATLSAPVSKFKEQEKERPKMPEKSKRHTYQAPAPVAVKVPEPAPVKAEPVMAQRKASMSSRRSSLHEEPGPPPAMPLPVLPTAPSALSSLPSQRPDFARRLSSSWSQSSLRTGERNAPMADEEFEEHLTSFDNVSASLGKSPYDAAMSPSYPAQANERRNSVSSQQQDFGPRSRASFDAPSGSYNNRYSKSSVDLSAEARRISLSGSSEVSIPDRYSSKKSSNKLTKSPPENHHLLNRKSLESMNGGRLGLHRNDSMESSDTRKSQKKYPPQAHAKHSLRRKGSVGWQAPPPALPSPRMQNGPRTPSGSGNSSGGMFPGYSVVEFAPVIDDGDDDKPLAQLIKERKFHVPVNGKAKPPVSMNTQQRNSGMFTPSNQPSLRQAQSQSSMRSAPPSPMSANFAPPAQAQAPSPIVVAQQHENKPPANDWGQASSFWAQRRQSAGEALQSQGGRRPSFSDLRNQQVQVQPQIRQSIESQRPSQPEQQQPFQQLQQQVNERVKEGPNHSLRTAKSVDASLSARELRNRPSLPVNSISVRGVVEKFEQRGRSPAPSATSQTSTPSPYQAQPQSQQQTQTLRQSQSQSQFAPVAVFGGNSRSSSMASQTRRSFDVYHSPEPESQPQPEAEQKPSSSSSWFPFPLPVLSQAQEPPPVPKAERGVVKKMQSWSGAGGGYGPDEYAGYGGSAYDGYEDDEYAPSFQERVREIYGKSKTPAPEPERAEEVKMDEYDHTYGAPQYATFPHASSQAQDQDEEEYYEQEEAIPSPHFASRQQSSSPFMNRPAPYLRQSRSSNSPLRSPVSPIASAEMMVLDRYGGGLEYGFEPGFGIGGSAGTRTSQGAKPQGASRKGVEVSQLYGVDFSDVPIIGQRVRV